jgi:hypothetical protein
MYMRFIIDIDQTLSTGFIGTSFEESIEYYQAQGLVIPATVATYLALFQLPEVMQIHEVLPGATEGATLLAEQGEIQYFTVRKGGDNATSERIQAVTRQWLRSHSFPSPENVVFCRSTMHKLVLMHNLGGEEPLVFIDDRWRKAIEALDDLEARDEESQNVAAFIRKHVTLVAFGAESVPARDDLHLMALSAWERIGDVMAVLTQVG